MDAEYSASDTTNTPAVHAPPPDKTPVPDSQPFSAHTLVPGRGRWVDDSPSTLQLPEPDQRSTPPLGVTPPVEGLDRIRTVEFASVKTRSFECELYQFYTNYSLYTCIVIIGFCSPSLKPCHSNTLVTSSATRITSNNIIVSKKYS